MKRTNWFLNFTLGFLVKIFAFLKGQRIHRFARVRGPAIVLSNHTSFYDFLYTAAALYPHRVSYMAAGKMFYDPLLGFFLRFVRAFPKCLFQADPVSTMNVFRILRQKGIVSIFPEGQISPIGVTQTIPFAIAKLIKKAKVDVYLAKHQGAYLVNPPWTHKSFPGRIHTDLERILTSESLSEWSEQAIYDVIVAKMKFNVFEFREAHPGTYRWKDLSNLESVIYRCPRCGDESMTSDHLLLRCPQCGNQLRMDRFGKLGGERIDVLYRSQEQAMRKRIEDHPDFRLSHAVRLESFRGNRLVEVGSGTLTLSQSEYLYEGFVDGMPTTLRFDPRNIPTLPSDLGRNIQIYEGYLIYQFVMDEVTWPSRFVIAGEIIHRRAVDSRN
jgi:1-acyl-sn-glycerol-3-phosphate acyltransferase